MADEAQPHDRAEGRHRAHHARGRAGGDRRGAAGFAGHSVTATLKLLEKRGETFRDRLVGGIVLGPEPLPEFPQPWPSGQDVATFGLARPTLAPTH
jgi:hypothetical protein